MISLGSILGLAGSAIGSLGGPVGTAVGGAIGKGLGGAIDGPEEEEEERIVQRPTPPTTPPPFPKPTGQMLSNAAPPSGGGPSPVAQPALTPTAPALFQGQNQPAPGWGPPPPQGILELLFGVRDRSNSSSMSNSKKGLFVHER